MKIVVALLLLSPAGVGAQDGRTYRGPKDHRGSPRSYQPAPYRGYGYRAHPHGYKAPYGRHYKTPPYRHYPSHRGYYPAHPYGYRSPVRPWIHTYPRYHAPYWSYSYPPYYYCR